jgi:hypothetical protein
MPTHLGSRPSPPESEVLRKNFSYNLEIWIWSKNEIIIILFIFDEIHGNMDHGLNTEKNERIEIKTRVLIISHFRSRPGSHWQVFTV